MTINLADNTPRVSYAVAAGVTQTSFTVSFEFFDDADLNVYVDGTLKTLTTDYTVTGGDGSTGSVTISVTGASGGSTVVITRDIDLKRATDFPASGAFQVGSLNTELDKLVAIAADLDDKASRALQLTDFDAAVSLVLPDVNTRKGKTLAFNASTGAVEAGPSTSDVQTVSATAADIASLADIEDGTTATDAISGLAAIKANVTTVAGIASNVTTVAGISSNVTSVAADASDIGTVASNISSVNTNASNITAIQGAAANASTATTKASEAASSATAAAASATTATTQATTATTQASTSTTKAGEAATSATASATSATASATSATASASSATAAAASQTAAASSAAAAATALDSFDDRYLGVKSSNPSVDNDGNALVSGALYFNDSANEMRVYDGANWIAATSAGNVSLILYEYTATSGQTTFSGSDDNSATLSYTVDNLQVVMNGVILDPSDFTATSGTSVVLAAGAALNDIVNIYAFKSFTTADMVSKSAGGTFAGAVGFGAGATVTGNVTADGLRLGDGDYAAFGDGLDLQILHSGTGSFITDAGTGDLHIRADNNLLIQDAAGSTNRMAVNSTGVGIGTTSPATTAHIQTASGNPELRVESTGANYATVSVKNSSRHYSTQIRTDQSNAYVIRDETAGANRFLIDTSGNVGIGQSSPVAVFHTEGTSASQPIGRFKATSTSYGNDVLQIICSRDGATSEFNMLTVFDNNSDLKALIRPDGDLENANNSYGTLSDQRYKENIVDAASQWDDIKALQIRKFNLIGDSLTQIGVVAQELETAGLNGLVYDAPEYGTDDDDEIITLESTRKGVKTSVLYMKAVKALQEAMTRIETLETQRADLEARLTALENA